MTASNDQDLLDWLRLARIPTLGPVAFWQLMKRYGNVASITAELPSLLAKVPQHASLKIPSDASLLKEIEDHHAHKACLITAESPNYPSFLRALGDAPPVLSLVGNLAILEKTLIGIVGGRNASLSGQSFIKKLSDELGQHYYGVVSGLARGIDRAAHEGSLIHGTIAVVAGGLDVIYPRENEELYYQIREQGLIISEHPLRTPPMAQFFPRRNRIISGLSVGVVVAEAALKSGSMITAQYALEQGREVFAVPGFPGDSRHQGCNHLLKQGATLVENVADILKALSFPRKLSAQAQMSSLQPLLIPEIEEEGDATLYEKILEVLGPTPLSIEELLAHFSVPLPLIQATLLELEVAAKITRWPGNYISRLYEN